MDELPRMLDLPPPPKIAEVQPGDEVAGSPPPTADAPVTADAPPDGEGPGEPPTEEIPSSPPPPAAPPHPTLGKDWSFGSPSGAGRGRFAIRTPLALALVVVVLGAVGAFWFLNRPTKSGGGTAFALSLSEGQSYRYRMSLSANGRLTVGTEEQPFSMKTDQTLGWQVKSVDAEGTATVTVTMEGMSGRVDGVPFEAPAMPPIQVKVTRDGQMLSAVGFVPDLSSGFGSSIPGTDQFLPPLPDHPVEPGDTWTVTYDQKIPYGSGRLHVSATNVLLRYENVDGVRTAVIQTHIDLPLDFTFDLEEMARELGQGAGQFPDGAKMAFGGNVSMDQTAWFDPAAGELVKTTMSGRFDMHIELQGLPDGAIPAGNEVAFVGSMTVSVESLSGPPGTQVTKDQAKDQTKKHGKHKKKKSG